MTLPDDDGLGECQLGFDNCGLGGELAVDAVPTLLYGPSFAIDVRTGDYILDAWGRKQPGDEVSTRVYLALVTRKGSAAASQFGLAEFPKVFIASYVESVRRNVQAALRSLINEGAVELVDVRVDRLGPNSQQTTIVWKNLTTSQTVNTILQ
jgi:hypothetical protein